VGNNKRLSYIPKVRNWLPAIDKHEGRKKQ
jgi:hypothetical protein